MTIHLSLCICEDQDELQEENIVVPQKLVLKISFNVTAADISKLRHSWKYSIFRQKFKVIVAMLLIGQKFREGPF